MNNQKEHIFINSYDTWQCDILELHESKYMKEKVKDCYINIFYNPANHLLFLTQLENKTAQQTLHSLLSLQQYIQKKDLEVDILTIVTDQGKEYYSSYDDYLKEHNITHRTVLFDDLQLAPINSMCRYIRQQLQQRIQEEFKSIPNNEDGQILITKSDLNKIIKQFIEYHNFEKKIPLFKQVPALITREQVNEINKLKRNLNKEKDKDKQIGNIQTGDFVRVLLLKNKLEKQRENKWSKGIYQIIYKIGQFYNLIPVNYKLQEYAQAYKIDTQPQSETHTNKHPYFGEPVYFRKDYQIKVINADIDKNQKYYPYEMENTNFYTFDKIISCIDDNGKKMINQKEFFYNQKKYNYKILQNKQEFIIKPYAIKPMDHSLVMPIEDNYWNGTELPLFYKPILQYL
ncbi:Conserved_hypothetical protein [Hexamita inflata]|uniref:Integrase catalytic domain-containing protein n=1 Tax=Hexamita inflata TaxID=28002 RepID=A0AA86PA62_9EUKA|nr:Conserved hypothetical protein [Hexamita inflata]